MQNLTPLFGENKILQEQGIYGRYKIIKKTLVSGDNLIECGFPPKLVKAVRTEDDMISTGESDFVTSYCFIGFDDGLTFGSSVSDDILVDSNLLTATIGKREYNGFIVNATGSGTVYFTCYS